MADVLGAFLQGHAAGQGELLQQQEMDARSLQQQVLKHSLDRLKIQDAWDDYDKKYQASERALAGLQGQPTALLPTTATAHPAPMSGPPATVPTTPVDGPPAGLADLLTQTRMTSPTASAPGPTAPIPDVTPPPLDLGALGSHVETGVTRTPVHFPGFNGQPGYDVTPQSREDLNAQAVALKNAEPYDLNPGQTRNVGTTVINSNTNLPPTAGLDQRLLKAVTDNDVPQQRAILAVMASTARAKGGTLAEQYASAVQNGDAPGAQTLLTAMTKVAQATKDPQLEALIIQSKELTNAVAAQNLRNITPTAADAPVSPGAQAIANYQLGPPSSRSIATPAGKKLMDDILRANPAYDASQFSVRAPTRKAFTTGTQGQQINAINTAIGHIDQLTALADRLQNGGFVPGNQAWNTVRTMFGSDKVTNFDTLKDALAGEVTSVLSKSGATVSGIAEAKEKIKGASAPAQLAGYVQTLIPVFGSKLASFNYQYHQAMGAQDPFSALSPEAKGILVKHGFDPDNPQIGQTGGGGRGGAPAMIEATDGQGHVIHGPAGTPLPAGYTLVTK